MKKNITLLSIFLISIFSCTNDYLEEAPVNGGYPDDVADIMVRKCAVSGCHNSQSRGLAGGLDFSSWDLMFDGGRNGTSVIPFSTENSYMLYTVNTDSTRGPVLLPTMPYNGSPLTDAEYQTLFNWISNGAPDKNGFVKFSDNPNRRKIYICMQGCDKVAVMDATTKVIMRYVDVGSSPVIEAPHLVRVSPDGQYWYVVFIGGTVVQKFRTSDDSFVGQVDIGGGDWNTIMFSPDGSRGFVNATVLGKTQIINLNNMSIISTFVSNQPHGGFVTPDGKYLYLTVQIGNYINKVNIDTTDLNYLSIDPIVLIPGQPVSNSTSTDAHEMTLSSDGSKYFVSCQGTAEVRVFDASTDTFITSIPVGTKPQEFTVSSVYHKVFVTCTEDVIDPAKKGSVYVIDENDYSTQRIYTGYQPHGIAADDVQGLVYVANLNYDTNGPAPHHVSACAGKNGYLTIIDMSTMNLWIKHLSDGSAYQYKCELLPYPYFVSVR